MPRNATTQETSTVLFALRYLQANYDDSGIEDSAHFHNADPLTTDQIDDLCEELNTSDITF